MSSTTESSQPLQGKVFAVTGGASGIGFETARILARRGATVCIADISPETLKTTEDHFNALNVPFMTTKVDVSKRVEVDSWIEAIVDKYGRLDGAANVAGIIGRGHGSHTVAELEDDDWDRLIAVNLTGTMYCLRAQLRKIEDGGSIVNTSSIHAVRGFARHSGYDASKHGVTGLTKAAALEFGHRNIRVNAVAPGAIYTPMMQKHWDLIERPKDAPFDDPAAIQRQGRPEEVAAVIAFLLGPESTYVSGSTYSVDGCWD